MKKELQDQLLKKYPEFFDYLSEDLKIHTEGGAEAVSALLNQKTMVMPIQFGFECGDGWFMLLDELMKKMQNHVKNVNYNRDTRVSSKSLLWFIDLFRKRKYNGWAHRFGVWMYTNAPQGGFPHMRIQVTQIKEKYGGLRFYCYGGDDAIFEIVDFAERLSYNICEYCGTTVNVGMTQGWNSTICGSCREKEDNRKDLKWNKNK